jgi:hypothetical protein
MSTPFLSTPLICAGVCSPALPSTPPPLCVPGPLVCAAGGEEGAERVASLMGPFRTAVSKFLQVQPR